jgi:hypothetical protein
MCCNNFWKKISIFLLTFLVGFIVAGLFKFGEPINIEVSVPVVEKTNNLSLQKSFRHFRKAKEKIVFPPTRV